MSQHGWSRRKFLRFMGYSTAGVAASGAVGSLAWRQLLPTARKPQLPFKPLPATQADALVLSEGFSAYIPVREGAVINSQGQRFGCNNDYLCFFPFDSERPDDGLLWVNHEYPMGLFIHGTPAGAPKTREQVRQERQAVGGSIVRVQRQQDGRWALVDDPRNRRVDGESPIALVAPRAIAGSHTAVGTLANCAGGYTPWGTVLTCEENYDDFYGELAAGGPEAGERVLTDNPYNWHVHFPEISPAHYGWVVEVDLFSGEAKKLTALGRFKHECATVRQGADGRCVVYSGSDENGGCLFKFVADKPDSLERGTLYVANLEQKRWISLERDAHAGLRESYADQLEVLIDAQRAAVKVGGTPLDRPEDIEVDPATGAVVVTLTNNTDRGNYFGSILRLREADDNPFAARFEHDTLVVGGTETGFACPDNLAFDRAGNLWFTTDVSGDELNTGIYSPFGNNGLFYAPLHGPEAGGVFRVASAPAEAELSGPFFSPDGQTLFLSVQHPGEETESLDAPHSHWPDAGGAKPLSCVVAIEGPALAALMQLTPRV